jgi:hypothetical protein|tara:strand:+ start:193 stop:357 length:165 start_codon:yes stop_codon:yes gene_type:complete
MDNRFIDKFDLRLRSQFLDNKSVSPKEVEKQLESLEDQSSNIEEIIIEESESSE